MPEESLTVIEVDDPMAAFVAVRHAPVRGTGTRWTESILRHEGGPDGDELGNDVAVYPFVMWATRPSSATARRSIPAPCRRRAASWVEGCIIHPNAVLYADVDAATIGSRSTPAPFWAATVSATATSTAGTPRSRTPAGSRWASDVEIGFNCTIDRATFEATRIGEGTKIDNLVMIGHNNQIGRHNLLCGQVGIAGSCKTGDQW